VSRLTGWWARPLVREGLAICLRSPSPTHPHLDPPTQTPKHPNTQTPKHPNTQTPKHPNTQTKTPNTHTTPATASASCQQAWPRTTRAPRWTQPRAAWWRPGGLRAQMPPCSRCCGLEKGRIWGGGRQWGSDGDGDGDDLGCCFELA